MHNLSGERGCSVKKTGLHVEISEKRNMEFGIRKCANTHY